MVIIHLFVIVEGQHETYILLAPIATSTYYSGLGVFYCIVQLL